MSVVNGNKQCPLCGFDPVDESNYALDCHTREVDFRCSKCGHCAITEIIERDGKYLWEELYHYPMDADGKVLRTPEEYKAANGRFAEVEKAHR